MPAARHAPLGALRRALQPSPAPALGGLLAFFERLSTAADLLGLADEFTPAVAPRVRALARRHAWDAALELFLERFAREHFPVHRFWDGMAEFHAGGFGRHRIPFETYGPDCCNGVDPLEDRPGFQLMWAIVFERQDDLLDALADAFGASVVERLGALPFATRPGRQVDGTRFAALAAYAAWMRADTGTAFLDVAEHHAWEEDIPWTAEQVARFDRDWRAARPLLDAICDLAGWLEAEPEARAHALIDAVFGAHPEPAARAT